MADYCSVDFKIPLRADTPQPIIDLLKWIVSDKEFNDYQDMQQQHAAKLRELGIKHPFFEHHRWLFLFRGADGTWFQDPTLTERPEGGWLLCVSGGIAYGTEVAEAFMDWIRSRIDAAVGEELGRWQYELWYGTPMIVTMGFYNQINMPRGNYNPNDYAG